MNDTQAVSSTTRNTAWRPSASAWRQLLQHGGRHLLPGGRVQKRADHVQARAAVDDAVRRGAARTLQRQAAQPGVEPLVENSAQHGHPQRAAENAENMWELVATPRLFHGTCDCTVTMYVVWVKPSPMPMTKLAAPSCQIGRTDARRASSTPLAMRTRAQRAVRRWPRAFHALPVGTLASGQPRETTVSIGTRHDGRHAQHALGERGDERRQGVNESAAQHAAQIGQHDGAVPQ